MATQPATVPRLRPGAFTVLGAGWSVESKGSGSGVLGVAAQPGQRRSLFVSHAPQAWGVPACGLVSCLGGRLVGACSPAPEGVTGPV